MSVAILIASLSITFIIAYVMFKINTKEKEEGNNHFLLQLIMLFFVLGGLLLSGKAALDLDKECIWQEPAIAGDNYTLRCVDNDTTTGLSLFKGVLWFVRLTILYIMIYFVYKALLFTNIVVRK